MNLSMVLCKKLLNKTLCKTFECNPPEQGGFFVVKKIILEKLFKTVDKLDKLM
jgi:hypothetical protein